MCIAQTAHISARFVYVRILTGNDMYCLDGQHAFHVSLCHNPNRKVYVLPRWSTFLTAVYMPESEHEMICTAQMVHLSASFLYVIIITGNDMYCLDGTLVCKMSICQNPKMKRYALPRLPTCLPSAYMSESYEEMICIVQIVHMSSTFLNVRIL